MFSEGSTSFRSVLHVGQHEHQSSLGGTQRRDDPLLSIRARRALVTLPHIVAPVFRTEIDFNSGVDLRR